MRSRADASYPRRACARGKDRAPVVVSGDREDRGRARPTARARPERAARRDAGARAREPRRAAFAAPVRGSRPDASARTPRALLARRVVHIDMVQDDACVRGNADRESVEWRGWCGSDALRAALASGCAITWFARVIAPDAR